MSDLTHFDESGASRMVDVGGKAETERMARASCRVHMRPSTLERIRQMEIGKGNVLEVARLAGIQAAKRTDELIPLCHSLPLTSVTLDFRFPEIEGQATTGTGPTVAGGSGDQVAVLEIEAQVRTVGRTGVEMEAFTAVSIAALTVYDMCKAIDRGMSVERIRLEEKTGGKSGTFRRSQI